MCQRGPLVSTVGVTCMTGLMAWVLYVQKALSSWSGAPLIRSSALAAASKLTSPGDSAWVLRGAFDDILEGRVEALASLPTVPEGAEEVPVLNFGAGIAGPRWLSMDDGIMGGLSSSSFVWDSGAKAAIFQGELMQADSSP